MSTLLVRQLHADDAATLQECRLSGLRESPDSFLASPAEVARTPLSQLEAELRDPDIRWFGAFDGDELLGFMRTLRLDRAARRHVAEVRSVYVRQSMRGRKIAGELLRTLVRDARQVGIESLILAVLADNAAARGLYESCGFQVYGTEPRAIRKGDRDIDQVLYSLDLRAARAGVADAPPRAHRSRLCALLVDCNTDDVALAASFWAQALGRPVDQAHPGTRGNYVMLETPPGEPIVQVQRVQHPSRVHIDIETDDIPAEVARLEGLGAEVVERLERWVVMQAPTGQRFCVVRVQRPGFPANATTWAG